MRKRKDAGEMTEWALTTIKRMAPVNEARRYVCTKEAPWQEGYGRSVHPDAVSGGDVYDWPNGDNYERFTCPHCNLRFEVTLPDA